MVATIHGAEQDVYFVGTQQRSQMGQKMETPSGEIYRYTLMGGTLGVAANLYQGSVPVANWLTQAHTVALAVGDTSLSFTDGGTAFVVDEAAGGTLILEETADLGAIYRVKSNNATASNETIMTFENGVTVQVAMAVAANNVLSFIKNPWREIVVHPSPQTAMIAGVPRVIIAANGFGWTQTRGMASCLVNGTHVIGDALVPSNGVGGSLGNKRTSGTGSVANATTTDVITHNAGHTPVLGDINIEFGEDPTTAPATRWLSTFTSTQFTVNVEVDPSTNGLDFSWTLEVDADPIATCVEVGPTADFEHVYLYIE